MRQNTALQLGKPPSNKYFFSCLALRKTARRSVLRKGQRTSTPKQHPSGLNPAKNKYPGKGAEADDIGAPVASEKVKSCRLVCSFNPGLCRRPAPALTTSARQRFSTTERSHPWVLLLLNTSLVRFPLKALADRRTGRIHHYHFIDYFKAIPFLRFAFAFRRFPDCPRLQTPAGSLFGNGRIPTFMAPSTSTAR